MRSTQNLRFLIKGQTRGSGTWTTSRTSTSTTMLARAERTTCESASLTKFLNRTSRQNHYGKDQHTEKRKRNCHICTSQQEKTELLVFKQVTGSVNRTDSTLHYIFSLLFCFLRVCEATFFNSAILTFFCVFFKQKSVKSHSVVRNP